MPSLGTNVCDVDTSSLIYSPPFLMESDEETNEVDPSCKVDSVLSGFLSKDEPREQGGKNTGRWLKKSKDFKARPPDPDKKQKSQLRGRKRTRVRSPPKECVGTSTNMQSNTFEKHKSYAEGSEQNTDTICECYVCRNHKPPQVCGQSVQKIGRYSFNNRREHSNDNHEPVLINASDGITRTYSKVHVDLCCLERESLNLCTRSYSDLSQTNMQSDRRHCKSPLRRSMSVAQCCPGIGKIHDSIQLRYSLSITRAPEITIQHSLAKRNLDDFSPWARSMGNIFCDLYRKRTRQGDASRSWWERRGFLSDKLWYVINSKDIPNDISTYLFKTNSKGPNVNRLLRRIIQYMEVLQLYPELILPTPPETKSINLKLCEATNDNHRFLKAKNLSNRRSVFARRRATLSRNTISSLRCFLKESFETYGEVLNKANSYISLKTPAHALRQKMCIYNEKNTFHHISAGKNDTNNMNARELSTKMSRMAKERVSRVRNSSCLVEVSRSRSLRNICPRRMVKPKPRSRSADNRYTQSSYVTHTCKVGENGGDSNCVLFDCKSARLLHNHVTELKAHRTHTNFTKHIKPPEDLNDEKFTPSRRNREYSPLETAETNCNKISLKVAGDSFRWSYETPHIIEDLVTVSQGKFSLYSCLGQDPTIQCSPNDPRLLCNNTNTFIRNLESKDGQEIVGIVQEPLLNSVECVCVDADLLIYNLGPGTFSEPTKTSQQDEILCCESTVFLSNRDQPLEMTGNFMVGSCTGKIPPTSMVHSLADDHQAEESQGGPLKRHFPQQLSSSNVTLHVNDERALEFNGEFCVLERSSPPLREECKEQIVSSETYNCVDVLYLSAENIDDVNANFTSSDGLILSNEEIELIMNEACPRMSVPCTSVVKYEDLGGTQMRHLSETSDKFNNAVSENSSPIEDDSSVGEIFVVVEDETHQTGDISKRSLSKPAVVNSHLALTGFKAEDETSEATSNPFQQYCSLKESTAACFSQDTNVYIPINGKTQSVFGEGEQKEVLKSGLNLATAGVNLKMDLSNNHGYAQEEQPPVSDKRDHVGIEQTEDLAYTQDYVCDDMTTPILLSASDRVYHVKGNLLSKQSVDSTPEERSAGSNGFPGDRSTGPDGIHGDRSVGHDGTPGDRSAGYGTSKQSPFFKSEHAVEKYETLIVDESQDELKSESHQDNTQEAEEQGQDVLSQAMLAAGLSDSMLDMLLTSDLNVESFLADNVDNYLETILDSETSDHTAEQGRQKEDVIFDSEDFTKHTQTRSTPVVLPVELRDDTVQQGPFPYIQLHTQPGTSTSPEARTFNLKVSADTVLSPEDTDSASITNLEKCERNSTAAKLDSRTIQTPYVLHYPDTLGDQNTNETLGCYADFSYREKASLNEHQANDLPFTSAICTQQPSGTFSLVAHNCLSNTIEKVDLSAKVEVENANRLRQSKLIVGEEKCGPDLQDLNALDFDSKIMTEILDLLPLTDDLMDEAQIEEEEELEEEMMDIKPEIYQKLSLKEKNKCTVGTPPHTRLETRSQTMIGKFERHNMRLRSQTSHMSDPFRSRRDLLQACVEREAQPYVIRSLPPGPRAVLPTRTLADKKTIKSKYIIKARSLDVVDKSIKSLQKTNERRGRQNRSRNNLSHTSCAEQEGVKQTRASSSEILGDVLSKTVAFNCTARLERSTKKNIRCRKSRNSASFNIPKAGSISTATYNSTFSNPCAEQRTSSQEPLALFTSSAVQDPDQHTQKEISAAKEFEERLLSLSPGFLRQTSKVTGNVLDPPTPIHKIKTKVRRPLREARCKRPFGSNPLPTLALAAMGHDGKLSTDQTNSQSCVSNRNMNANRNSNNMSIGENAGTEVKMPNGTNCVKNSDFYKVEGTLGPTIETHRQERVSVLKHFLQCICHAPGAISTAMHSSERKKHSGNSYTRQSSGTERIFKIMGLVKRNILENIENMKKNKSIIHYDMSPIITSKKLEGDAFCRIRNIALISAANDFTTCKALAVHNYIGCASNFNINNNSSDDDYEEDSISTVGQANNGNNNRADNDVVDQVSRRTTPSRGSKSSSDAVVEQWQRNTMMAQDLPRIGKNMENFNEARRKVKEYNSRLTKLHGKQYSAPKTISSRYSAPPFDSLQDDLGWAKKDTGPRNTRLIGHDRSMASFSTKTLRGGKTASKQIVSVGVHEDPVKFSNRESKSVTRNFKTAASESKNLSEKSQRVEAGLRSPSTRSRSRFKERENDIISPDSKSRVRGSTSPSHSSNHASRAKRRPEANVSSKVDAEQNNPSGISGEDASLARFVERLKSGYGEQLSSGSKAPSYDRIDQLCARFMETMNTRRRLQQKLKDKQEKVYTRGILGDILRGNPETPPVLREGHHRQRSPEKTPKSPSKVDHSQNRPENKAEITPTSNLKKVTTSKFKVKISPEREKRPVSVSKTNELSAKKSPARGSSFAKQRYCSNRPADCAGPVSKTTPVATSSRPSARIKSASQLRPELKESVNRLSSRSHSPYARLQYDISSWEANTGKSFGWNLGSNTGAKDDGGARSSSMPPLASRRNKLKPLSSPENHQQILKGSMARLANSKKVKMSKSSEESNAMKDDTEKVNMVNNTPRNKEDKINTFFGSLLDLIDTKEKQISSSSSKIADGDKTGETSSNSRSGLVKVSAKPGSSSLGAKYRQMVNNIKAKRSSLVIGMEEDFHMSPLSTSVDTVEIAEEPLKLPELAPKLKGKCNNESKPHSQNRVKQSDKQELDKFGAKKKHASDKNLELTKILPPRDSKSTDELRTDQDVFQEADVNSRSSQQLERSGISKQRPLNRSPRALRSYKDVIRTQLSKEDRYSPVQKKESVSLHYSKPPKTSVSDHNDLEFIPKALPYGDSPKLLTDSKDGAHSSQSLSGFGDVLNGGSGDKFNFANPRQEQINEPTIAGYLIRENVSAESITKVSLSPNIYNLTQRKDKKSIVMGSGVNDLQESLHKFDTGLESSPTRRSPSWLGKEAERKSNALFLNRPNISSEIEEYGKFDEKLLEGELGFGLNYDNIPVSPHRNHRLTERGNSVSPRYDLSPFKSFNQDNKMENVEASSFRMARGGSESLKTETYRMTIRSDVEEDALSDDGKYSDIEPLDSLKHRVENDFGTIYKYSSRHRTRNQLTHSHISHSDGPDTTDDGSEFFNSMQRLGSPRRTLSPTSFTYSQKTSESPSAHTTHSSTSRRYPQKYERPESPLTQKTESQLTEIYPQNLEQPESPLTQGTLSADPTTYPQSIENSLHESTTLGSNPLSQTTVSPTHHSHAQEIQQGPETQPKSSSTSLTQTTVSPTPHNYPEMQQRSQSPLAQTAASPILNNYSQQHHSPESSLTRTTISTTSSSYPQRDQLSEHPFTHTTVNPTSDRHPESQQWSQSPLTKSEGSPQKSSESPLTQTTLNPMLKTKHLSASYGNQEEISNSRHSPTQPSHWDMFHQRETLAQYGSLDYDRRHHTSDGSTEYPANEMVNHVSSSDTVRSSNYSLQPGVNTFSGHIGPSRTLSSATTFSSHVQPTPSAINSFPSHAYSANTYSTFNSGLPYTGDMTSQATNYGPVPGSTGSIGQSTPGYGTYNYSWHSGTSSGGYMDMTRGNKMPDVAWNQLAAGTTSQPPPAPRERTGRAMSYSYLPPIQEESEDDSQ